MTHLTSRLITSPDILEHEDNHPVIIIDPTQEQIDQVVDFCRHSKKLFDVYVYTSDTDDLMYLSHVTKIAEQVLISDSSHVSIKNLKEQTIYGPNEKMVNPLDYFKNIDNIA